MVKKYDAAVVIGRFQIPHIGHNEVFNEAFKLSDKLIIIVGSIGQPRTPKNPFTFEERHRMLIASIPLYDGKSFSIYPVRDKRYNLQHWIVDVVNKVNSSFSGWTDKPRKICLVGHHKDASSFYLDKFPQWDYHEVDNISSNNSTDIRNSFFEKPESVFEQDVHPRVANYLMGWSMSEHYENMVEEKNYVEENYIKPWSGTPYTPTFNTADAVVVQSGHILLIKRKFPPGKNLWALPGGFLGNNETLRQTVLRELQEETKIHLQEKILDRNIKKIKTFDDPGRDSRGRFVTQAHLIELDGPNLPRVYGSDDAEKAKWFPLNEAFTMGDQIYEDHLDIILNMIGEL